MPGGVVAQERILAAGQHGRHVARVDAGGAVADTVDAAVGGEEGTTLHELPDFPRRKTGVEEL